MSESPIELLNKARKMLSELPDDGRKEILERYTATIKTEVDKVFANIKSNKPSNPATLKALSDNLLRDLEAWRPE